MFNRHALGVSLLFTFLITTALRDTTVAGVFHHVAFFQYALIAFGTTSLTFLTIVLVRAPGELAKLRSAWKDAILVNLTTCTAWLSYFGALKLVEPSIVNAIFSGIAPVTVTVFAMAGFRAPSATPAPPLERALHIGLALSLGPLVWVVLSGHSAIGAAPLGRALAGLALAAVSGVVITAETIISKRMNDAGISSDAIVAIRFDLVALVALVMVVASGQGMLGQGMSGQGISGQSLIGVGSLAVMVFALIALPIYAAQLGLALTSPMTTNVILALAPLFVLGAQVAISRTQPSLYSLVGIGMYALLAVASALVRTYRPKAAMPALAIE